jgi:cytochrome c553
LQLIGFNMFSRFRYVISVLPAFLLALGYASAAEPSKRLVKPAAPAPHVVSDGNLRFSHSDVDDPYAAPNWGPGDGPAMPVVVATGNGPAGAWACSRCHMPNGSGRPNYGDLAGLNADYILRQVQAFKTGDRTGKLATLMLTPFAKTELVGEADLIAVANYYAGLKPHKTVSVVEAAEVPRTINGPEGLWIPKEGTVPLGKKVVMIPDDPDRAIARDPRATFTAYVPPGSIAKGKGLITGDQALIICAACHGPELKGEGDIPRLAGRYPAYIYRQLQDIKTGTRRGGGTAAMQEVVLELSDEEMLSVAAYVGSLDP